MRHLSVAPYAGAEAVGELPADVERIPAHFQRTVLWPLMASVATDPDKVREVVGTLRHMLENLDGLLAISDNVANGAAGPVWSAGPTVIEAASPQGATVTEIGRNQRAQVREMHLLELLSAEPRPYTIQQLMAGLAGKGHGDSQPAVVSQLHRMRAGETISQPGTGLYEITTAGLSHLQKLRKALGPLLRK